MEGELIAGRFAVEEKIGTGAMGTVHRARDLLTGQLVALKVLHAPGEHAERFAREASAIAEISHPGAVRYVAHGILATGEPFLAMQWIDGETLSKRLQRGTLSIAETLIVGRRLAAALGAAHVRKLVHRDVKPANVMLAGGAVDSATLVDFGLARRSTAVELTRTGMLVGTPGYIAPEQARGERDLGPPADVFSLGATLFRCVTGRSAFSGDDIVSVLAKVLFEPAPRISQFVPEVPRELDDLVALMLEKDPAARPADGNAVATALARIAPPESDGAPPAKASTPDSLTQGEQRLVSVIVAQGEPPSETGVRAESDRDRLMPVIREYGATVETLASGALVATLQGTGSATDQAVRAGRCALRVQAEMGDVPVVLATGRGVMSGPFPVGDAIERAAGLLASETTRRLEGASRRGVRIDETTAGLLDARFEVAGDEHGLFLAQEREATDATRKLLGMVTPCVGRERELGSLLAAWQECAEDSVAGVMLVVGDAGFGKSRLRYEFLRRVKERGDKVEVWACRGDPMRAGSPFTLAGQLVRQAARVLDGEPLTVRQQKLRARVARHVPPQDVARVSEFLGEIAGAPFGDEGSVQLRSARRDALLMGDLMQRAWEDFLAAECRANPVLLVLEDLQWGDLPTIKLVDGALRALAESPLMVLSLARADVHEAFPKLWSGRPMTIVHLGEISRKAAEKLVRHVLGNRVTAPIVARLVELAGGNVFYLEELIRSVASGHGNALPETVLAMVHARLDALEADARQVLRAASVFGDVFWEGGVTALVDTSLAPVVGAWLDGLCDREIISRRSESRFPGEREFIFRNELVREAAYATLTSQDRAVGHRMAGTWLERAGEADPRVLAEHFERSGQPARAVRWYLQAADQAAGGNDLDAAVECASRGIECGATREERGLLLTRLGNVAWWRGDSLRAVQYLQDAVGVLDESGQPWFDAAGQLTAALGRMHRTDELRAVAARIEARAHAELTPAMAIALALTCVAFAHAGDPAASGALLTLLETQGHSPVLAEPRVAARVAAARGALAHFSGDVGAMLEWTVEGIRQYEQYSDRRNACSHSINLGFGYIETGMYEEAEQVLRNTLATGEQMGLDSVVAAAKQNLGLTLAHLGRPEEALALQEDAIEAFHVQKRPRMEDGSRIYLAHSLARAGRIDEAADQARKITGRNDIPPTFRAYALAMLAHIELLRDQKKPALVAAREAHELLVSLGGIDEGESLVRLVWAEALFADGQETSARAAIADAANRLQGRAARMTNPAVREAFMTQIPENAMTVELAAAWAD